MKNIIVLCGGVSAEHEVSLRSAKNVIAAMDRTQFNPILVLVSRSGTWYMQNDVNILEQITVCEEPFNHGQVCSLIHKINETFLINLSGELTKIDAAFPLIHGTMGEDGTLQGMLEVMDLPYVGCGVLSSAVGMDKDVLKRLWESDGVPVVPFVTVRDIKAAPSFEEARAELESEILFVKAAVMGSSVGVHKVRNAAEYATALADAFRYSEKVLVEKFIPCHEVECSVLGENSAPSASCVGEVRPTHDFYSYEAKYLDPNGTELIIPAQLPQSLSDQVRAVAIKAYRVTECAGFARVDFFINKENNEIYVNEINTIPGFTSISMYPKMWEASGLPYSELITKLIELAYTAYSRKKQLCLVPQDLMPKQPKSANGTY